MDAASCSVLESEYVLLGRKLQSLMFATSGGFAQFDKLLIKWKHLSVASCGHDI